MEKGIGLLHPATSFILPPSVCLKVFGTFPNEETGKTWTGATHVYSHLSWRGFEKEKVGKYVNLQNLQLYLYLFIYNCNLMDPNVLTSGTDGQ